MSENLSTCKQIQINIENLSISERIDSYLAHQNLNLSRTFIKTLIEEGKILLNNKPCKVSSKVNNDDQVYIELPEPKELDIKAENIPLNIIFEDENLILINKQAGLTVHPTSTLHTGTLVNALLFHNPETLSQINGVRRPGIVHRLDRDTTGLMLICKNDIAHKSIAEQIKNRTLARHYQTLVLGNFKEDAGSVTKPIGRDLNDRKRMRTFDTLEHARYAKTNWRVLKRFRYKNSQDAFTLLECKLDTGRTHQIRVHMNHIKHPIIGDPVYGIEKNKLKAYRPLLHSYKIGFTHPISNQFMEFETELPEDFQTSLSFLVESA